MLYGSFTGLFCGGLCVAFRLAVGCCLVLLCFVEFVWLHSCGCGLRVVELILLGLWVFWICDVVFIVDFRVFLPMVALGWFDVVVLFGGLVLFISCLCSRFGCNVAVELGGCWLVDGLDG